MTKRYYLVADGNGIFVSEDDGFTKEMSKAKKFQSIGGAMRRCIKLNVHEYTYRVRPIEIEEKTKKE